MLGCQNAWFVDYKDLDFLWNAFPVELLTYCCKLYITLILKPNFIYMDFFTLFWKYAIKKSVS